MSRLTQLADVLDDMQWHTNAELVEKVGHRFGAQILELRKGKLDGLYWVIEGEPVEGEKGVWRYRCTDLTDTPYVTHPPICPKCGYQMTIHDVRQETP